MTDFLEAKDKTLHTVSDTLIRWETFSILKRQNVGKHTFLDVVTSQVKYNKLPVWFQVAPSGLLITRNLIVSLSTALMLKWTVSPRVAFIAFETVSILGGKLSVKKKSERVTM